MGVLIVAAADSPPEKKASATYLCTGANDHFQIMGAIAMAHPTDVVLLLEGTYNVRYDIVTRYRVTLRGEGSDKTRIIFTNNAHLFIEGEHATIEDFAVEGTGYSTSAHIWLGVINILASHARIRGIYGTADHTLNAVFHTLSCDATPSAPLRDIEFDTCIANNTGTFGFLHNWWDGDLAKKTHTDIRYLNCVAARCGNAHGSSSKGHFNDWVTGFDFAETNDIDHLYVNNCRAEDNLESGFHMEWDPRKTACVFEDCVATGNGAKPYPTGTVKPDPGATKEFFGSGWYLPNFQGYLYRCISEGNARCGFWVTNGGVLVECVDRDCGRGRTNFTYVKPTSFYGYPCRTPYEGKSLHLVRCKSIDSRGYGFWYDLAEAVVLEDCHLTNPAGINGIGAMFGSPLSEHFRESAVGFTKITTAPDVTAIVAHDNRNTTYGPAVVVSDAAKPVIFSGAGTRGVVVTDWTTASTTLPPESDGIFLEADAHPGNVIRTNVIVVPDDPIPEDDPDAPPIVTPTATGVVPILALAAAGAGAYLLLRARGGTTKTSRR